eukprot:5607076-Pyramimonas_sp.AAC.1
MKIICGLLNLSLAKAAETLCGAHQRGFIRGRNPSDNIVSIDGFLAFEDVPHANTEVGCAFFDFTA